eukprot:6263651-Lingulodinium_polyedra.AAC.1
MRSEYADEVGMYDSCLSGAATVVGNMDLLDVESIGMVGERSRFRGREGRLPPRLAALREPGDPFSDPATVKPLAFEMEEELPAVVPDPFFQEVAEGALAR